MTTNDIKVSDNDLFIISILKRLIPVSTAEARIVLWAWLYIFSLFLAYYLLRPVRDSLGVSNGIENLPWLFTATMVTMLLLNPLFSALVRQLPRARFIAVSYRFFTLNLLIFSGLFLSNNNDVQLWVSRAFFIWVSVFNLFVISVFWSTIVDAFSHEQGKRIFGFLAAAATSGGILGSSLTGVLIAWVNTNWLLLFAAIFIEVAVFASSKVINKNASPDHREHIANSNELPVGGSLLSGMTHTLRSPYLLGIAGFMVLYSLTSTFLYFQQAHIAAANFADSTERTLFFARIDLWVNIITLMCQLFLTAKLIEKMGIIFTLGILPLVSIFGFSLLAATPTIAIFATVQIARRVTNFALARPTRELLFTSLSREDRYKAKNFIDTVVYRLGDQAGSWSYAGLIGLSLGMAELAVIAIPCCLIWLMLSIWLARKQLQTQSDESHEYSG
jgi:ATP/ADP translocase